MKINAKTVQKPVKKECPLCRKLCVIHEGEYAITFDCTSCKTFRIARNAMTRLVRLKKDHRRVFMIIARNKHLEGEILEVSLSPDDSFCLSRYSVERNHSIENKVRISA